MEDFLDKICKYEDFCSLTAASNSQVDEAEKKLGLKFAKDYKEYVLTYGAATFNSRELTGVCSSNRLSVIYTTERARMTYPLFPKNMYVVEEILVDHMLIVQDASGKVYEYGPADKSKFIGDSLVEYLFPDEQ